MIISNKSKGARYSTDATAHTVRSFINRAEHPATPSPRNDSQPVQTAVTSIEALYPALFANDAQPRPSLGARVLASLRSALLAIRRVQVANHRS